MRKISLWQIGLVVLTVGLTGCGKEETAPPVSPPQNSTTLAGSTSSAPAMLSQADLDAVTKASKPYKIALIVKTKNNPFFIPMIEAFEQTAKELGAVPEVQAAAQESSYEQQVALVENEVSKGMQAILITPADSKALVPALKKAQEKGVRVINLDNRLDPETLKAQGLTVGGYVGADNEAGGRQAGEAMLKSLNGSGKVAVLEGIRGVDNAEARKRGFESAVKGKLVIAEEQTAEWETDKAYAKTQAILAKNPDLKGIFCANDKMAVGAMKAIAEAKKTGKVVVVGYDNIKDVQPALASGEMSATIEQHPDLMGKYGVRLAIAILDGKMQSGGEFLVPLETKGKK